MRYNLTETIAGFVLGFAFGMVAALIMISLVPLGS